MIFGEKRGESNGSNDDLLEEVVANNSYDLFYSNQNCEAEFAEIDKNIFESNCLRNDLAIFNYFEKGGNLEEQDNFDLPN